MVGNGACVLIRQTGRLKCPSAKQLIISRTNVMCVNIKHRFVNGCVFSLLQLFMGLHFYNWVFPFWSELEFVKCKSDHHHNFKLLTSCNKLQVVIEIRLIVIRFNLWKVKFKSCKVRFRPHKVRFNPCKVRFPSKMANTCNMFKLKIVSNLGVYLVFV